MNDIVDHCVRVFQNRYAEAPEVVVKAPGRVNLIGEHTDYNEGFVFPAAIDRWIAFAARPRSDNQAHLHAVSFEEDLSFTINRRLEKVGDWLRPAPRGTSPAITPSNPPILRFADWNCATIPRA